MEFSQNLVIVVKWGTISFFPLGDVDTGGTKTYSRGSLEFRATYVSVLLFQASYVWIKFRVRGDNKASKGYLYLRITEKKEERWEPRYSPHREGRLNLGQYKNKDDAKVVLHAAQYYYKEEEGRVDLCDGFVYSIPHMSDQERCDTSPEKRNRVPPKAQEVLEDYKRQKENWENGILSDEFLRDIEVNQLPNLQNEGVQATELHHPPQIQQYLEEQNSINGEHGILSDEFQRDIGMNHLPNLQNEEVQAAEQHHVPQIQQYLEEQNSNFQSEKRGEAQQQEHRPQTKIFVEDEALTKRIVEKLYTGSVGSSVLKDIWERLNMSHGDPSLEPSLGLDGVNINQQLNRHSETEQPQQLLSIQQPMEQQVSAELLEFEIRDGHIQPASASWDSRCAEYFILSPSIT